MDWDRRLFDALIPCRTARATTLISLKAVKKTALIDTVDPPMKNVLFDNLDQLGIEKIDYVIFNHAEPDHAGSIREVLDKYPDAKAVCTDKCKVMLIDRFRCRKTSSRWWRIKKPFRSETGLSSSFMRHTGALAGRQW